MYGAAFIILEKLDNKDKLRVQEVDGISYRDALFVGVFQVLSMIPGTSRSGSTILGGRLLGLSRASVAEFSFFMAIPTMLGASALKVAKLILSGVTVSFNEVMILAVGSIVAFAVSMLVIRFLIDYVKRHTFLVFGAYRIALGLLLLLYFLFTR